MNKEELINIAKNFKIDGEPIKLEKCESGHINSTYVFVLSINSSILQFLLYMA